MAEENQNKYETSETSEVEVNDRGIFDFIGKKKEQEEGQKPQEEVIVTEFGKVKVSEGPETKLEEKREEEGEKKHSILEQNQGYGYSSSYSSHEGLKEKIEENIGFDQKDEDTTVAVEKVEVDVSAVPEEKKGLLDKIKEKLPGHKKTEDVTPVPAVSSDSGHEGEAKEKKGILEKIKEKLPGHHHKTEEEKEKESATH